MLPSNKWTTFKDFILFIYLFFWDVWLKIVCKENVPFEQWRLRNIFHRGQSHFSRCEIRFFPVEIFHFGTPKQISVVLKSEKQRSPAQFHSSSPSLFSFPPSLSQCSFFSPPFPLFSLPLFSQSMSAKIYRWKMLGALYPLPLPVMPLHWSNTSLYLICDYSPTVKLQLLSKVCLLSKQT